MHSNKTDTNINSIRKSRILRYRIKASLILLASLPLYFIIEGWMGLLKLLLFFTRWGYIMTIVYFFIALTLKDDSRHINRLASFFHLVYVSEIFITVGFWLIIAPFADKSITNNNSLYIGGGSSISILLKKIIYIFLHTVPCLLLVIEQRNVRYVLKYKNIWNILGLFSFYGIFNTIWEVYRGYNIYPFVFKSFVHRVGFTIAIFALLICCFCLSLWIRKSSKCKIN